MRLFCLTVLLFSVTILKAQSVMPLPMAGYIPGNLFKNNITITDGVPAKKWSLNRYSAISSSFMFFKGGNASILSVPVGLQLTRTLNKNMYAFATVGVAPAYVNFNGSFLNSSLNKTNQRSIFGSNSLGLNPMATMGLMYINDEKTFSVSGSISIEKSSYPMIPVYSATPSKSISTNRNNQ